MYGRGSVTPVGLWIFIGAYGYLFWTIRYEFCLKRLEDVFYVALGTGFGATSKCLITPSHYKDCVRHHTAYCIGPLLVEHRVTYHVQCAGIYIRRDTTSHNLQTTSWREHLNSSWFPKLRKIRPRLQRSRMRSCASLLWGSPSRDGFLQHDGQVHRKILMVDHELRCLFGALGYEAQAQVVSMIAVPSGNLKPYKP